MPIFYMLFSVLSWSLFPLISAWGIDQIGIFDYILWTYVVGCLASYGMMRLLPGYKTMQLATVRQLNGRLLFEIFIGCLTVLLSFACLLTSFSYISKAGATIIFEIWPIVAMYITPLLIKRGWDKISTKDMAFSVLAFIGVAFLMYPEAQGENAAAFFSAEGRGYHALLPLLGGIFMAIASVMKSRVSHLLQNQAHPVASLLKVQVFFSIGVVLIAIPFALFWPDKASVYTTENIMAILCIGLFIHTLGNVSYTLAVLRAEKSNIIVLWYLMPIFSVVWLWLAGQSAITPYIVLGTVFIITSNLIMTVKADNSLSYVAAIMMILLCGVYAYFVEGLGMPSYYEAIAVPIVFYAILVAFMMDRLIRSDRLEEQRAIEIVNHIDSYAAELRRSANYYIDHVIGIISTNNNAIVNTHYRAVRNADEGALRNIHNQLDELVVSKLRGTSFAEMFVLLLVGALIVFTAMIFRPADIVGDSFSVVLSLTVMFIFFTVVDLQQQRRHFYLSRDSEGRRSLIGDDLCNLSSERALSALLIVVIMLAFLGLLLTKRYPALFI